MLYVPPASLASRQHAVRRAPGHIQFGANEMGLPLRNPARLPPMQVPDPAAEMADEDGNVEMAGGEDPAAARVPPGLSPNDVSKVEGKTPPNGAEYKLSFCSILPLLSLISGTCETRCGAVQQFH
jgi:hypothetical protein